MHHALRTSLRTSLRTTVAGLALAAAAATTLSLAAPATAAPASPYDDDTPCSSGPAPTPNNPGANSAPVAKNDVARVIRGGYAVLDVLANDTDPDGDQLSVLGTSASRYGETCIQDGKVVYFSYGVPNSTRDSFTYTVGDGDRYTTATVFLQLDSVQAKAPLVTRTLAVSSSGKVTKYARVLVRNPDPDFGVRFLAGGPESERASENIYLKHGASSEFGTPKRYLQFVTIAVEGQDYVAFVNSGVVDTRTGKVHEYSTEEDYYRALRAARLAPGV